MDWRKRAAWWVLAWAVASGCGAAWLAHARLQALREVFDTDARIAHRLLSQRMVQHDAILGTLALLQPRQPGTGQAAWKQLPGLYPQVLDVARRAGTEAWPQAWPPGMAESERRSQASGHAELALADLAQGRLFLVQSGLPASYALALDLRATIPADEWPLPPATSPVRAWLTLGHQAFVVQPGRQPPAPGADWAGWTWEVSKTLASPSQPLVLHLSQRLDATVLPWAAMLGWAAGCALVLAAWRAQRRQHVARHRAEQLLQLGQVARLNTLGELAAGMAHELNQPLTAVLSSSQAARRLLAEEPPETDAARQAMVQAAEQAKRASAVVGRLRRLVERPGQAPQAEPLDLVQAVAEALHLLEPELRRRQVQVQVPSPVGPLPPAHADAVAVQQILHNLLLNALQAMEDQPPARRQVLVELSRQGTQLLVAVQDSGPGVAPDMRPRLFTPFATGRAQGLGLGLTLSQGLAESMGGSLELAPHSTGGARFELRLPLASDTAPSPTVRP
ncbi:MAG: two-component sensor histidine kinase [Burkholderiaceae bacterium]|jgi:signal transduction histidine kinase|nr:two-component sensor histidine kinase [Burkholderiaceae bacterium]